jgi:prevent-host-death family protein
MKKKVFRYPPTAPGETHELKDSSLLEIAPVQINVRAAKDSLSSLLEEAARGTEIIITSDGKPKAKLVPMQASRKRFKVDWELLKLTPAMPGPKAEELIRADRDGRP